MKILFKLFLIGVLVFGFIGCSKKGGGGGNNNPPPANQTISNEEGSTSTNVIYGYVIDEAIEEANITIFSLDGNILESNITTDSKGYYEIKIDTLPNEYIVYSQGGKINQEAFNGELFAYCQEKSCNLTPLSTLTYQYANLLLEGTFEEKYNKS